MPRGAMCILVMFRYIANVELSVPYRYTESYRPRQTQVNKKSRHTQIHEFTLNEGVNPFNTSCSKFLLLEGFSAVLV